MAGSIVSGQLVRKFVAALLIVLAAPAVARGPAPLVLAAASLQEALGAAADGWAALGHARPVISFAASSALARQVVAGAPADLFISADEQWMDALAARRLIVTPSRAVLVTNRLALIAPAISRVRLPITQGFPLARALGSGRLAVADPASVPAGRYARTALTRLGVWRSISPRIAAAENVRAALALVERSEAPLGIVYATDARASRKVRVVGLFPAASHPPIRYPIARLVSATSPDAEPFRRFLLSAEGQTIFRRFGFGAR